MFLSPSFLSKSPVLVLLFPPILIPEKISYCCICNLWIRGLSIYYYWLIIIIIIIINYVNLPPVCHWISEVTPGCGGCTGFPLHVPTLLLSRRQWCGATSWTLKLPLGSGSSPLFMEIWHLSWIYGGAVGLSLSLFSLKHDPGLPKVSRQDRGGLSSHLLCVGGGGTQAFPGGFPPTVQGVEGIGFSLALPPLLPGHCRHWNGPECTWLPPVVQYRRGPLSKASGP